MEVCPTASAPEFQVATARRTRKTSTRPHLGVYLESAQEFAEMSAAMQALATYD